MFHIGICDAGEAACAELGYIIRDCCEEKGIDIEVTFWSTGESLCQYIKDNNLIDITFLDLDFLGDEGIEVGKFIREELENSELILIYLSSENSCAMQLFQVQPLGLMIKPLIKAEVEEIVLKSIQILKKKRKYFEYYLKGIYYRIPYEEIIYFSSDNKKVNIITKNKKCFFNSKLKEIVLHAPQHFIMIHQSYFINSDYILEYSYDRVKMAGDIVLNISRPHRKAVKEFISTQVKAFSDIQTE